MHYAAHIGKTEVATFLINNGANLDAVDKVSMKYLLYYILVMCPLQSQYNQLLLQLLYYFNIIIKYTSTTINYNYSYFLQLQLSLLVEMHIQLHIFTI